jgi:hypothetical protein
VDESSLTPKPGVKMKKTNYQKKWLFVGDVVKSLQAERNGYPDYHGLIIADHFDDVTKWYDFEVLWNDGSTSAEPQQSIEIVFR